MAEPTATAFPTLSRRRLLTGAGAAAVAGALGASPAEAHGRSGHHHKGGDARPRRILPLPKPIPGGTAVGLPAPLDFVHIFLPGPTDATTPFLGLPGEGLDVEPSTITDFRGRTAFAVLSGRARGNDGKNYNVEFDVRVIEGRYVAADGSRNYGAFGFF